MGVADQADALLLHVEALARLGDREHVLPDRVARAGVVQADARALPERREAGEEVARRTAAPSSAVQRAAAPALIAK